MMEEVSLEGGGEGGQGDEDRLSESLLKDDSVILYQTNGNGIGDSDLLEPAPDLEDDSCRTNNTIREKIMIVEPQLENVDVTIEESGVEDLDNNTEKGTKNECVAAETSEEDLLASSIQKLDTMNRQNTSLVTETEQQKEVIELLRQQVSRQELQLATTENKLKTLQEDSDKKYNTLLEDSNKKIADLKKAFDTANKDKESMVIKYAMGEKDLIIARRGKEEVEKKLKESCKDKEGLQYKIKTLSNERTRLQGLCDVRGQETLAAKREGDKLREEVRLLEGKHTQTLNKLKTETESHDQTRESLNTTFKQLCNLQSSIDEMKAEAEEVIRVAKAEGEEVKKKGAEQEAEQSVKLMIDSVAAAELEAMRKKHKELIAENNELSQKIQSNQQELSTTQCKLSDLKEIDSRQKTEIVDLYAKCAELESVRLQLERETEKATLREAEVTRLREEAVEVQTDMAQCRRKEAELLEFTQKLTDKNVSLQSEFSSVETRATEVEEANTHMASSLSQAEAALGKVTARLEEESSKRREETELLARKLAEKTRMSETDRQAVIDMKAELEVVKRQNVARMWELTKELTAARRKLDQCSDSVSLGGEGGGGGGGIAPEIGGLSPGSRCSSSSSLHRTEDTSPCSISSLAPPHTNGKWNLESPGVEDQNRDLTQPDTQQLLVEKIVKLQRSCARRQEKLDFLEEHVEQLLAEIKKKNRVIQHYLIGLEPGALISEESELHKAVMGAAGVGIMASLYGSRVADGGMTLELSLEINKKLQAVLEDTLLKNITLKESLSTLGEEISKMAIDRHRESKH